jgi:biopolymer transport protein ExbB
MDVVTFFDLIRQGAYATYPLIACSVIVLAITGERLWALRGLAGRMAQLSSQVGFLLRRGDLEGVAHLVDRAGDDLPLGRIYRELLPLAADTSLEELGQIGEGHRLEQLQFLRRNIWLLGTIGSAAPFVGLFGTVIGIIKAFHSMARTGTGGFAVVAAGISEALVATALGLAVAIIAVVAYNYFQVRLNDIAAGMRIGLARFVDGVRAGRAGRGARQVA